MKLAFCIFKYFPYGGLQRDFMKILNACLQRGHDIDIYVSSWQGEKISNLHILAASGFSNHQRMKNFSDKLKNIFLNKQYDAIIGFDKIVGLDIYFAGDVCLKAKLKREKKYFYQLFPRYKTYLQLENFVFNKKLNTTILFLAPQQKNEYIKFYSTQENRFYQLPAGIEKNLLDETQMAEIRKKTRWQFSVADDEFLVLFVASNFYNKGLDRALKAFASLQNKKAKFLIIGGDKNNYYKKMAKKYGIVNKIIFLGAQDDLKNYMIASDLLLHPARVESAGMALLEAITFGLPLLTNTVCGYFYHIKNANAGIVMDFPFSQKQLNKELFNILDFDKLKIMHNNTLIYARNTDLYSMAEKALGFIEKM